MKSVLLVVWGLLSFTFSCVAQISPTPVINNEIKDNSSIRMRSIELERIKRSANQTTRSESSIESETRFAQIKEDFEGIQKLETSIVKAYTTEININYPKIREYAREITKKAIRLRLNFFDSATDSETDVPKKKKSSQKSLKDLIVELDRAIERFVSSPVFKSGNIVDSKVLEKTQLDLLKIIVLSDSLSKIETS
jgi:hypothetical protein